MHFPLGMLLGLISWWKMKITREGFMFNQVKLEKKSFVF